MTNDNKNDVMLRDLRAELSAAKREQQQLRQDLGRVHNSLSWKLTHPLRRLNSFLQRNGIPIAKLRYAIGRFRDSVRIVGLTRTLSRVFSLIRNGKLRSIAGINSPSLLSLAGKNSGTQLSTFYPVADISDSAASLLPRALIVAEMSIPQCKKYRVVQKAELLAKAGMDSTIVDWTDLEAVRSHLQSHPIVIFYRVPAVPEVILLINEAKRLGVRSFWEVDDLIFDPDGYLSNKNLDTLDPALRETVLAGMKLYREALLLCDEGIGSTRTLARIMSETTGRNAHVIENALDNETLNAARRARRLIRNTGKLQRNQTVTIVYGSGTKTHDIDFLTASSAIYNILSKRKNVRLRIIGELNIEDRFHTLSDQIERFPFTDFDGYLETIAQSDISIAPLEESVFNDAKSNIKYLEASILGLPSVCSPCDAFKAAIIDGETGFLASTPDEWEEKLLTLIDNPELRQNMAWCAHKYVCQNYNSSIISKRQAAPLVATFNKRKADIKRILLSNIFFSPQSFGGATIVAEEMARRLARMENTEVYVFTSWPHAGAPDYGIVRYDALGAHVFAVKIPTLRDRYLDIEDTTMGEIFKQILKAIRPDIVHLHSIQTLGITLASACRAAGIPYAITLHDAWWLCERQFMVTGNDKYCFQTRIDPAVCARCVPDKEFNEYRTDVLRTELVDATGLISPSVYFKNLHMQNGVSADKIFVNNNGIKLPSSTFLKRPSPLLRFGYVGGATSIKGYDLIKKAFSQLPACDIELVIVDNTLNQGYSSIRNGEIDGENSVRIVPAYTQDKIDDFFSEIDVLLFPTQWKESFGLTVREALIRDIWVITSDAGGAIEDIVNGVNGEIIPISSDSSYLKAAMDNAIKNRESIRTHINPFKDKIQTFEAQASELHNYLIALAGEVESR